MDAVWVRVVVPLVLEMPVTVTVPDSGGGLVCDPPPPPLLPPPQLSAASRSAVRIVPSAAHCNCRRKIVPLTKSSLDKRVSRTTSKAKPVTHHSPKGGLPGRAGYCRAEAEAVTVMLAVLFV
jgi:hypothetical protein